jgi:putative endonuclease
MHYLYILKSKKNGKYYIGETSNIQRRVEDHQRGRSSFGKRNKEIILIYTQEVADRSNAKRIEAFFKKQKSHLFIDRFLAGEVKVPK